MDWWTVRVYRSNLVGWPPVAQQTKERIVYLTFVENRTRAVGLALERHNEREVFFLGGTRTRGWSSVESGTRAWSLVESRTSALDFR